MNAKVSVILTTYNGALRGYLKDAIESVLRQSYKDYELIIVDDGSKDETKNLCKAYLTNTRVKYVYQENRGLAVARNKGIANSSGDFICFLDDDDVWDKDKLKKQVDFFLNNLNSNLGMIYTAAEYIDKKGMRLGIRHKEAKGDMYKRLLFEGNIITCPSSVMIRKGVLDAVGILNEEMKSLEDLELWIRIAKKFSIHSLDESLVKYRIHDNRITMHSYKREEFYERLLYCQLLQKIKDIDQNTIYRNMYQRFVIRHFSLGNYKEARKFYAIASSYKSPSLYISSLFLLAYLPPVADIFKEIRRKVKGYLFLKKYFFNQ